MTNSVKLDPNKSRFKPKENKKTQEDFEKEISALQRNEEGLKARVIELSSQFMDATQNKILEENRGIIGQDVERELVNSLGALGLHINNDEHQPEGIGSIGLIMLLMNVTLKMRDRLNEQAHKIHLLEQQLNETSSKE